MKDLNQSTLQLVQHLENNHDRLMGKFRSTLIVVIWVGGDEKKLAAWAEEHGIKRVPMGVIDADEPSLIPWRINPETRSTTVLTMPRMPKEVILNFNPMHHVELENAMDKHFARYARK